MSASGAAGAGLVESSEKWQLENEEVQRQTKQMVFSPPTPAAGVLQSRQGAFLV